MGKVNEATMSDVSGLWNDLVNAALLGTERRPYALPMSAGALGDTLAGLRDQAPEAALLSAAATLALYRRAGRRPTPLPTMEGAPSPASDLPPCSAVAGRQLALMLTGQYAEVLPEWLRLLAKAGGRVASEYLPALLDLARSRSELRPAVAAVLGRRGEWLANQNPEWAEVAIALPQVAEPNLLAAAWETAEHAVRLELLRQLRAQTATRAASLTLLAATWKEESAEDRAAFVSALADGLSLADEAFLETALDDRAKGVRAAAADLLASLPQSQLAGRMAARLQPLVQFERGWFKVRRFGLDVPARCDEAMQRDGIELKPRGSRGERAWWLLQIVAAAPLDFWTRTLEATPAECIHLAESTEWRGLLVEGWAQATARQAATETPGAAEWAEALLKAVLADSEPVSLGVLLLSLAPERREEFVSQYLQIDSALGDDRPAQRLLADYWDQWAPALSRVAVEALRQHIATDNSHHPGRMLGLFHQVGFCADPAVSLEFAGRLQAAADPRAHWPQAVERFLAVAEFRRAMHQELKP
jgi:hypothetical protein